LITLPRAARGCPAHTPSLAPRATDELNEEAGLKAKKLIPLTPNGIAADKYSMNRLHCYLALDCVIDNDPKPQDETEDIGVERGVTVENVLARLEGGEMPAPSAMAALLGIQRLRELQLL